MSEKRDQRKKENLTSERIFSYDNATGALIWNARERSEFKTEDAWKSFNSRFAGQVAGSHQAHGYWQIGIGYKTYLRHVLVWIWHHGPIPKTKQIDHKFGAALGDKIENLRLTNTSGNAKNRVKHSKNKSGFVGVHWVPHAKKWRAWAKVDGKIKHLGYFSDVVVAGRVARAKRDEMGYSARHGK